MDVAKRGANVEEDDEFEDFEVEDWAPNQQDLANEALWDKDWDDNNLNDSIGQQLRQLVNNAQTSTPPVQQKPQ